MRIIHHISKKFFLLLFFFITTIIIILIAQAQIASASTTVTLGDPLGTNEIVILYQVGPTIENGNAVVTRIGAYNSSETFILEDNQSYILIRQPSPLSLADAPTTAIDMYVGLLPRIFIIGLFMFVFATICYIVLRLLRVI